MEPIQGQDCEVTRSNINQQIRKLFNIEDARGLEMFITLHRVAHLSEAFEALENQSDEEKELSGPRMRLMIRLLAEEKMGNKDGLTPTVLSHFQRVSKNTISALLRGLEEQGYICRTLDSTDLRVFRIQLTDAGREMVLKMAPRRIARLNELLAGMDPDELNQLEYLLEKFHQLLVDYIHNCEMPGNAALTVPGEPVALSNVAAK
jgi:DNA-binding MarR family transcriptional regulator